MHLTGECFLDLTHIFEASSVAGSVCEMGRCDINTTSFEQLFGTVAFIISIARVQKLLVWRLTEYVSTIILNVGLHFKNSLCKKYKYICS